MIEVYKIMNGMEKQEARVFKGSQSKPEVQQKPVGFLHSRQWICGTPCLRIFGCSKFTWSQEETGQVLEKASLLQEQSVFVWRVSLSRNLAWQTSALKLIEGRRALWGKYLMWLSCSYSSLVVCL